jgi:hypothetical protein
VREEAEVEEAPAAQAVKAVPDRSPCLPEGTVITGLPDEAGV